MAAVVALDLLAVGHYALAAHAAPPSADATPAPTATPTPTVSPNGSPSPAQSPGPAAAPVTLAWVDVPVANVWEHVSSVRHVDRPSLLTPPRMRAWFRGQTLAQRLDLESRLMTQALRGERVVVLATSRGFAQVRIEEQVGSSYPHGIIGWVAARQLSPTAVPHAAMSQPKSAVTAVRNARTFVGVPYVWAGMSSYGIDCSGLTYRAYLSMGITLPRDAADQSRVGAVVSRRDLRPGDLVFFGRGSWHNIHHVGIYAGRGLVLHAPHTGTRVRFTPLSAWRDYWGARRLTHR
ncbi:MAG: gamma-D-glutamyl-L-lysine dipeptidyl-peptidase [Frankiaceae bacterium]|nr:gamma-D-glutamyl-L-lysine dipeptidyl-peptidase [Frankiaceae bacterium]